MNAIAKLGASHWRRHCQSKCTTFAERGEALVRADVKSP